MKTLSFFSPTCAAVFEVASMPLTRGKLPDKEQSIRFAPHATASRPLGRKGARRQDSALIHPQAVFAHTYVGGQVTADSLVRIAEYVAEHGLGGKGPYQAARDLLLR